MKRISSVMVVTILWFSSARADVIKPNDVRATSHFGVGGNIENLVNGDQGPDLAEPLPHYGLVAAGGAGTLDDEHDVVLGGSTSVTQYGWISGCNDAGIAGGTPTAGCADPFAVEPVDDQIVEFEFDGAYDLNELYIWNDNEDGFAPDRGLDEFEIQVNTERTGGTFTAVGTTYNLTADSGFDPNSAQVIPLDVSGIRRVRLLLNSIHGPPLEKYAGLSEVRFDGTLVTLDAAADGDKDSDVDGQDFLLWQRSLGLGEVEREFNSTLTATQSEGDYDNNNVVNADDLTVWGSEFGSASPISAVASASIPEPSSLLLAATAVLGGLAAGRHRFRRWHRTHAIIGPDTGT
jgi:hypothetical protein